MVSGRKGGLGQRTLYAAFLVGYALAFLALFRHEVMHVGEPDLGFVSLGANPGLLVPTRVDVAQKRLRLGTRVLAVNDRRIPPGGSIVTKKVARMKVGDENVLTVHRADGAEGVKVPVTAHGWRNDFYAMHLRGFAPLVYLGIAVTAFLRRSYEPTAWGLFAAGCLTATWLTAGASQPPMRLAVLGAFAAASALHVALVFPEPMRAIATAPGRAWWAYAAACVPIAASEYNIRQGQSPSAGLALAALLGLAGLGTAMLIVRCGIAAARTARPVVQQRAQLILAALALGVTPLGAVMVIRVGLARLWMIPDELLLYATGLVPLALGDAVVRRNMIDLGVALRRGGVLFAGGAFLVFVAAALDRIVTLALGRLAMGAPPGLGLLIFLVLLVPVVLSWPQVNARLDAWLHPKRAHLPELRRKIGAALGACTEPDEVLEELAAAPAQLCDTDTGAAFLLAGVSGPRTRLACSGSVDYRGSDRLAREPVVRMLMARQQAITRESVHVDPEVAPVADNLLTGFDRLRAGVLLPIVHGAEVVGGLAVGQHRAGGVHDRAELQALSGLAQQALQIILHPAPAATPEEAAAPTFEDAVRAARAEDNEDAIATEPDVAAEAAAQPPQAAGLPAVPRSITGTRYKIVRSLGEGGYKRVYLAQDLLLDRPVALALLKPKALQGEGRRRVQREAQAMARLGDHPHIVNVYDMGEAEGEVYLVSQFMEGGALKSHLARVRNRGLPLPDAIRIADQVCRALSHAHRHGIVHRDLKPANIWLTGAGESDRSLPPRRRTQAPSPADARAVSFSGPTDPKHGLRGTAKLGDFGLAFRHDLTRLTDEGVLMGTVAYMAPEQLRGELPTSLWDLYSLGVVLYEMCTGRRPFTGEVPVVIAHQHLSAAPTPPREFNPRIPLDLEQLILSLLAKDPKERPPTAVDVRQMLVNIML